MKRIICFILALSFIFCFYGCESDSNISENSPKNKNNNESIENVDPCANGHTFMISYTNSCEDDGYKISKCSVCNFEKKEEAKATGHTYGPWKIVTSPGCETTGEQIKICECGKTIKQDIPKLEHSFEKNECKYCNYTVSDISQLPLDYRIKIAEEIKLIAPFSSDLESLSYVCDIYLFTLKDLKNCENAIQSAINKFNSVPMVRVLDENGRWIWVQHEPSLIEARNELEQAKNQKAKTEELLEVLKYSMDINAQGAAWNVIIEELGAETTSNKKIASRLTAVLFAYSYTTENNNPEWKEDVFSTFKEKTGLEIDLSLSIS